MREWWLIYKEEDKKINEASIRMYIENAKKLGAKVLLLLFEEMNFDMENRAVYVRGEALDLPEAVINRTRESRVTDFFLIVGVKCFNGPLTTLYGNDKYKAVEFVKCLGITVPETRLVNRDEKIRYEEFPLVMKSLKGHGGNEVFWVNSMEDIKKHLPDMHGDKFVLQKPVSDLGKDLRVYCMGDDIYAAMLRESSESFKSNFSLGGSARVYELNKDEIKTVKRILRAIDATYCGIDFIFDKGKIVFNEIEDMVGARMLYKFTDLDPVRDYVKLIDRKIREK